MVHWLFPANIKFYDVFGAFRKTVSYWPANATVTVGDLVFIYLAAPYKQIGFLCEVKAIGISFEDALPYIRHFFKETIARKKEPKAFMKLRRTATYKITDRASLSYKQLKQHGLTGMLMGPRKLENNPKLLEYIKEVCNELRFDD
jgi:hypothetical protein